MGVVSSPEFLILMSGLWEYSSGYTYGVVFLPLNVLQAELGIPNMINEVVVVVKDRSKVDETISEFKRMLAPYDVIRVLKREEQPSYRALKWDIEGFREISVVFPALILLVAAVEIYTTLRRLIISQQREIGVLKTMGFSTRRIVLHYMSFALVAGIAGSVPGALLSIWISAEITKFYTRSLGIPFTLVSVDHLAILQGVVIGVIACMAGAILPSLAVTRLKPVEILRPYISASMVRGRVPLIERAIIRIKSISIRARLTIRNLFRNRIRTGTTVLGIAFSVMLVFSIVSFMDSFYANVGTQYDHHMRWDLRVRFSTMKNVSEIYKIGEWDGVISVEPFIMGIATVSFGGKSVETVIIAYPKNTSMHVFNIINGEGLKDGAVVLGEGLAAKLGVSVGDEVRVNITFAGTVLRVSGIDREPLMLHVCFMTLKTAHGLFNATDMANGALLRVESERIPDVRRKLYEVPGVERVDVKHEVKGEFIRLLDRFMTFAYVMLVISVLVASSLILNIMTTNVMERRYEVATLRILGVGMRSLLASIALENVIMVALGILIGCTFGYLTAWSLIQVFLWAVSEQMLTLELVISPMSVLLISLVVLVAAVLSQIPAMRYVSKINLARAVKEAAL